MVFAHGENVSFGLFPETLPVNKRLHMKRKTLLYHLTQDLKRVVFMRARD